MKTIKQGILTIVAGLLLISATSSFAIENLRVSLQASNVVLSWPSIEGGKYIVQHQASLNSTSGWATLTSSLPAATGTNQTFYVHSNAVQLASGSFSGTNGGIGSIDPGGTNHIAGGTNTLAPGIGFYRVVRDGVYLLNSSLLALTNGTLSNTVDIAFEVGNAANDGTGTNVLGDISCASLIIDGTKFAGDGVLGSPAESSPWRFSMDTAYLENGDHTFQIENSWLNPNNSDGNHVNITRRSDPITITVSNAISYPQWEPEIGEAGISAYFLKTTCTNADWQIDIYDVSNRLAQTLSGHTDDGTIEAYWNMVDTNGVTRTNADLDPEFSSIVTVGDPITKATPVKKQRADNWPDHGKWVITYQDFFKFEYSANNLMQSAINYFAVTTGQYGGYYLYYPQSGQTNDIGQTYPMRYQKTNHIDTNITATAIFKDRALLLQYLSNTNSRNFFFDGHGFQNNIASISSATLKANIKHRYRFVMLDACSTANGDLDKAFGINGPGTFDLTHYEDTGIRPAAFCGYNIDVIYSTGGLNSHDGMDYDDTIPDDVPYFISNFLFYWRDDLQHEGLRNAINDASNALPNSGGPGQRERHWLIYGYDALKIDEFNYAGDTW